jgi:nucleotide-binding universal stress UspA family protein
MRGNSAFTSRLVQSKLYECTGWKQECWRFSVKILIAIDGSQEARTAMLTAIQLLKPEAHEIDLLCVAPTFGRRERSRKEYERRILRETTQILDQAKAEIATGPSTIRLIPEMGSPAAIIVDKAPDYDLTVVGSKGWGTNPNAALGPVASRVAEHALGAVLIGRQMTSEAGARVLVPVDGSTASLRAVEALQTMLNPAGAEICLMHVAETPWIHLGMEEDWVTASEEEQARSEAGTWEKELLREGETIVEEARERLRNPHLTITTRIDEGNPSEEILSEAERGQYDLVVVGASGNRDLKHQMLGSVSSKITWNAPCSVLIVREPEEAAE